MFSRFLMCFVAHSIVIQPAKAELPGLFSEAICSSNQSDIVKPWCHCKDQFKLGDKKNDIEAWCRSYERFSQCVETSLQENSTLSEGFLNQVFDKKLMDKRMQYLCSDRDFFGVEQCVEEVSSCQQAFRQQLSEQQQWDTQNACSITETLASCIWTKRRCLAKLKYLLARLSDSYTTSKCTKYFKESVGTKCVNLRRELYPNTLDMDTCLKGVQVQVKCLNREMMDSEHTEDMFYNIDADRTNVYIYETFRCENIQLHGNKSCFHESSNMDRQCLYIYSQGENNFKAVIRNDEQIPIEKICSFFNRTTECFKAAQPDCHPRANHLVAIFCSVYPKSCQCPMGLTKEYADKFHKDGHSTAFPKSTQYPFGLTKEYADRFHTDGHSTALPNSSQFPLGLTKEYTDRFHKDGHSTSYSCLPNIFLLLCTFGLCTFFVSPKLKYF